MTVSMFNLIVVVCCLPQRFLFECLHDGPVCCSMLFSLEPVE